MSDEEPRRKVIFGPEPWREVAGVSFSYWDRWLLRLVVEDPHGLGGIVRRFHTERERTGAGYRRDDAEAKLSQVEDLVARLAKVAVSPREILGELDASDKRLLAKAHTKLFDRGLSHKTPAMIDTLRRRLTTRALRGHWAGFAVSPAQFEPELQRWLQEERYHDWRQTPRLSSNLEGEIERLCREAESEAERIALYRAALTVIVESMECVDDSGADMAMLFGEVWNGYLAMPWERAELLPSVYFRDLIEFAVWEDYGLVGEMGPFFGALAPDDVAVVESVFADVVPELRSGGFDYQEEHALCYRVELLIAQRLHERFVEAAAELGSRAWRPIVTMAKEAFDGGRQQLAMSVFAAANQPGRHREYLEKACTKMLGRPAAQGSLR